MGLEYAVKICIGNLEGVNDHRSPTHLKHLGKGNHMMN